MEENQNGDDDTLNTSEEVSDLDTETQDESSNDLQTELEKAKQLAENYKIRAEKAERVAKQVKQPEVKPEAKSEDLSQTDFYALVKANVAEEDISEIKDYANLKKISITEALKTSFIKSYLGDKEEQRKVAQATNVSNVRRGSSQVSEEVLEENARQGKLPTDDNEIKRLARNKIGLNKNK